MQNYCSSGFFFGVTVKDSLNILSLKKLFEIFTNFHYLLGNKIAHLCPLELCIQFDSVDEPSNRLHLTQMNQLLRLKIHWTRAEPLHPLRLIPFETLREER